MPGELILTSYTYDQGRVAINNYFSGTAYFNDIDAAGITGDTIYSGSTNLYNIFASGNTFYDGNGTISGDRMTTTSGDLIWRRSPSVSGEHFRMLLWNDADNTSSSLYFKCEDNGPGAGNEFRFAKFGLVFSGTGIFGEGDAYFVMNSAGNSSSATTVSDTAIKINSNKTIIFSSGVTMNTFMDLTPQASLPTASTGRVFFSGSPLFRLMVNTGGTSADWMTLNG